MKKIVLLLTAIVLMATGCGSDSKEDLIAKFEKEVSNTKSYKLEGTMSINSSEESFIYNLEAYYLQDDYFKVKLVNQTNNHEQIILRNESGVYVVTPSLNKSFKFDSIWPENSSQAYFLNSLANDLKEDGDSELLEADNGYIIKSVINYPNNSNLKYQKVYFNKDMVPTKVEVYDANDSIAIEVVFTKVDMNANLTEEEFKLEDYVDNNECLSNCETSDDIAGCKESCNSSETSNYIDNIAYPLYLPNNTSLTSTEEINNETTDRVILTFGGDKNFVLIEEASNYNTEFEIIPINGNPVLLNDTIGAISTNSMYFTRNGIDYYIVSNDLTNEEMINVALSIGGVTSVSSTK